MKKENLRKKTNKQNKKRGVFVKSPIQPKDQGKGDSSYPKASASHHDKFFKQAFSEPSLAKDLVKLILTSEELTACKLKNLKVEEKLSKAKKMDLILTFGLKHFPKKQIQILILVEHKSQYSRQIYQQILDYQALLYREAKKPTILIPVVFYHGKSPWKHKLSFQQGVLGKFFLKIPPSFKKTVLEYEPRFIDTKDIENERLRECLKDKSSGLHWVLEVLDRSWFLRDNTKELRELLFGFFASIKKEKLIIALMEYLRAQGLSSRIWKSLEREAIKKGLLNKGGYMDVREDIKQEGIQIGWQKGLQAGRQERNHEVILNMLRKNTDISFISEVTGLSVKEIKKLKNGS